MIASPERRPTDFGPKLIWTVSVLQCKSFRFGVLFPTLAALAWGLLGATNAVISQGLVQGNWSYSFTNTPTKSPMTATEMAVNIGFEVLLAGLTAAIGLSLGLATLRHLGSPRGRVHPAIAARWGRVVVASTLKFLLIILACVPFFFPGVWLAARLIYVQNLILERDLSFSDAVNESWRLTSSIQWRLFSFMLALLAIAIVAALATLYAFEEWVYSEFAASLMFVAIFGVDYAMGQAMTYDWLREKESPAAGPEP